MRQLDQFPNNLQTIGSHACGPISVYTIHQFFGTTITTAEILKDLGVSTKTSTFPSQLAQHLRSFPYDVQLLTSCSYLVSPHWIGKSSLFIAEELQQWLVHHKRSPWRKGAQFLRDYLASGGMIKIINLTTHILDEYLEGGYLILACLEESWLWGRRKIVGKAFFDDVKGSPRGHFVVLFDGNDHEYAISDPFPTGLPGRSGNYFVSKDTVMISILLWGATVVAVKRRT